MAVEFLSESPLATVQDTGRTGRARYGYRRCGACDAWSARIAGLLCGNEAERLCKPVSEQAKRLDIIT